MARLDIYVSQNEGYLWGYTMSVNGAPWGADGNYWTEELKTAKDADGVAWFLAWQLSQLMHNDVEDLIEHAIDHEADGELIRDDTLSFRAGPIVAASEHLKAWREGLKNGTA